MTKRHRLAPVVLAMSLAAAGGAFAAARVETVAVLAQGASSLEGLDLDRDGAIWLTSNFDNRLVKVRPDGTVLAAIALPLHPQVNLLTEDGGQVVTGHATVPQFGPRGPIVPSAGLGTALMVLDAGGTVVKTIAGPQDAFFNGIARLSRGVYLMADSVGGRLWRADIAKGVVEPWLTDASAESERGKGVFGGANGLKIRGGAAYYTSGGAVWRVKISRDGKPSGQPTALAKMPGDDFDIAKDGSLYVPSGTALMRISPAGQVSKVADLGVSCPTAMMARDGKSVFLLTRGGFPGTPNPASSRLLRVWLDP